MSAGTRRAFRITVVLAWLVWALFMVRSVLAQDGSSSSTQPLQPNSVDEVAARLMPLLVGATLIERAIEFLFNWLERAILDASHSLHNLATSLTGLVQMDLRPAWQQANQLASALVKRAAAGTSPESGDANSANPDDWPLAKLQAQIIQSEKTLAQAEKLIETALKSPEYVARKKVGASVISIVMGILLAFATSLSLFEPLGIEVADWFEGAFDILDVIMAGVLMGLGTDWVHQVIGLLVKGKGLLGRASGGEDSTGALLSDEDIKQMVDQVLQSELQAQLKNLLAQAQDTATDLVQPAKAEAAEDDSPG
jgi:hypothetical protein